MQKHPPDEMASSSFNKHGISFFILLAILLMNGRECYAQAKVVPIPLVNCPVITGGNCPDPGIRFILYTRQTPPDGILFDKDSPPPEFDRTLPTKILMHGFNEGITVLFRVRDAYLQKGDYNIISVDWNKYGKNPCYPTARFNAAFAGKCTAQMINKLRDMGVSDLHMIGMSLGAHGAGYTANSLKPYKLPRITGLDPAGFMFELATDKDKLDASDAEFVDVIHTNALVTGKADKLGHVDFYMNGGSHQPGCTFVRKPVTCDHLRAVAYYSESILTDVGFWAWKCGSQAGYALGQCPKKGEPVLLGEYVDKSARGFHVAHTKDKEPYALGIWKDAVSKE